MDNSEETIAGDLPKGTVLLTELSDSTKKLSNIFDDLSDRIENGELSTKDGLSLLELKNLLFLGYLSNLSFTTLLKLSGLPLNGNSAIDHLVELRVILEKMRPLESKFKPQIEKFIKDASVKEVKEKPSSEVKNSIDNIDDSSEDEVEQHKKKHENQVYKIPKISQVHYPEEEEKEDVRQKRERMRALKSSMLKDALLEHTEDPEVIHNLDTFKQKAVEKRKQIERYEESTFTRLSLSKKEKAAMKQMTTPGNLSQDLLSFRSLEGFDDYSPKSGSSSKRKRPGKSKKGQSKGKKKRKKH